MPKPLKAKDIVKAAEAAGWRSRPTGSGHVLLYSPDGVTMVTLSSTPSDPRAVKNALAQLRRGGLTL